MGRSGRPAVVLGFNRGGLALARGLGRAGLEPIGVAYHPYVAYASRFYSERILVAEDGEERPTMLQALERIAESSRPVVFPATEETVAWTLRDHEAVREIADVALPRAAETVHALRRKDLLPEAARKAGIPAPRTVRPASCADLVGAGLTPPLVIKPIEGKAFVDAFGAKVFTAATIDEAIELCERATAEGFATIVQELIPNHEGNIYSFFGYLGDGARALAAVTGLKVRAAPRDFGSSAIFEARWDDRVYERALALLASVEYRGFAHVELAYDERIDDFSLIEVNTRVPTWAGIGMTRDFNMAAVAYRDLCGDKPTPIRLTESRSWVDFIEDVRAGAPRRPGALVRFLAPYARPRSIGALFAPDDPAPGVRAFARPFKRRLRALRTRTR